jgi:hypothetical protein
MVMTHPMLQPVVALLIWSMLIWFWVMITRVPAMQAMKIKLDPTIPPKELTRSLPARVRWIADNYNHLIRRRARHRRRSSGTARQADAAGAGIGHQHRPPGLPAGGSRAG